MTYTTEYIPFKYYKNINPNPYEMDFQELLKDTIKEVYINIKNSNVSTRTKKQYIGILRNNLGIKEMIKILINNYDFNFSFSNLNLFFQTEIYTFKADLKIICDFRHL